MVRLNPSCCAATLAQMFISLLRIDIFVPSIAILLKKRCDYALLVTWGPPACNISGQADFALQDTDSMREAFEIARLSSLLVGADRYTYRRFLRARQHDLPRATEMWLAHLRWRKESGADSILQDFSFPERDAFISLYPQGYCNVDKMVRASTTPAPTVWLAGP